MNPYEKLANAIILQAVKDYRSSLKALRRNPNYSNSTVMKRDCERFFRSGWFEMLTDIDGETLIRKLKQEASYDD